MEQEIRWDNTRAVLEQYARQLVAQYRENLAKGNRNGTFEVSSMGITPDTTFTLVNELLPFWEDRYSVALKSENFSIALSAEDPKTGKKGSACVRIYVIENGKVTIDDLGKYMDTSMMTLWITP